MGWWWRCGVGDGAGGERGGGASCKQSDSHRGLAMRQAEEGGVDRDDDGELLLAVRGH